MNKKPYIKIPTNTNGVWSYTEFLSRDSFRVFVKNCFKEPGTCGFNEVSKRFNEQAKVFSKKGLYCEAPEGSRDYITYWDTEKEKCRKGVIFSDGSNSWYLPRDLYFWWNFLKIADKEKKTEAFPEVWDVHYYMALYNILAQLYDKHSGILKKRQIGSSLYHMAKLINLLWFEKSQILKMGASAKDYINNDKGSWLILDYYRDFLNKHTGWYRPMSPDKSASMSWQQRLEVKENGRISYEGNSSKITGTSFEKNATAGVGGPCLLKDSLILMADASYKKVQDILLGDLICGADGLPKKVVELYSGVDTIYEIKQTRGATYYTTADHSLYLWNHYKSSFVKILAKNFNNLSIYKRTKKLSGIKFSGIKGQKKELPIDPYYLGLFLGDGTRGDYRILVNETKDPEIAEYITQLAETEIGYRLTKRFRNLTRPEYNDTMTDYGIVKKARGVNSKYSFTFDELGLEKKHIPNIYYTSSKEQRLELLAGLIDTDGYLNKEKKRYEISITDKVLADDIVKLSIQLGFNTQRCVIENSGIKSTVYNKPTKSHRINITGNISIIPCKVKRKIATDVSTMATNNYSKLQVTKWGIDEYFGFACEDSLFVLEDGTITHNCRLFFHEEAGIAPKMGETFEFMRPALSMGGILTGQFIAAGSVGNLDQCKPLENMIKNPHGNSIYAVKSTLVNENGDEADTGLFIPEQWGRPPHIDQYGNSLVQEALEAIKKERHVWEHGNPVTGEKPIDKEKLQLRISQQPINIDEAFAIRKTSLFPNRYVKPQIQRIEDGEYKMEYVDLERNELGQVITVPSKRLPLEYGSSMTLEDKRACVVIYKHPIQGKIPLRTYLGSIDPVAGDKSITSASLACIYIYEMPIYRVHTNPDGTKETTTEGGRLVASWTGRYDDVNETNEQLSMLVEYYQAYTTCEYNVGTWVQYMIAKKRTRYVAVKEDMMYDKELGITQSSMNNYGWYNVDRVWKKMLQDSIDYIAEEILVIKGEDGEKKKVEYGITRIPDIWLLREMQQYQEKDGRNYDRIIAFCALVAFVNIRLSTLPGLYTDTHVNSSSEQTDKDKKMSSNDNIRIFKENTQTFRNLLGMDSNTSVTSDYSKYKRRSPFKNLR